MRPTVVPAFLVGLLAITSVGCDKKQSTPPPVTDAGGGGGADAGSGTDGGGGDAGGGQDAGGGMDGGACIRQNCVNDTDCAGLDPDGGTLFCMHMPATASGNYCQRTCNGDAGSCPTGQECQSGRCTSQGCTPGGCTQGFDCRSFPNPNALCLPACTGAGDCCASDDAECLANVGCDGGRCAPKPCSGQSDCNAVDAGLTCVSYVAVYPAMNCTSQCDTTTQCQTAAKAAGVTEILVCQ